MTEPLQILAVVSVTMIAIACWMIGLAASRNQRAERQRNRQRKQAILKAKHDSTRTP